ncbi:protein of unknown function [Nitrospira japonica]|uniref:Uncharacterized protein n=1 Tax=Nitrospira japonica TaxID=1325564 RepID=A0A1W1I9V3_9BACT|nr:protein of unknown function [Nitrospira japonica]
MRRHIGVCHTGLPRSHAHDVRQDRVVPFLWCHGIGTARPQDQRLRALAVRVLPMAMQKMPGTIPHTAARPADFDCLTGLRSFSARIPLEAEAYHETQLYRPLRLSGVWCELQTMERRRSVWTRH